MVLAGLMKEKASGGRDEDSEAEQKIGIRRKSPSIWNATQYAISAHFGSSSQTRNTARRFKLLTRLDFRRLPDSRNLEH